MNAMGKGNSAMTDRSSDPGRREVEQWRADARRLAEHGLYDPAHEHDSCGVGLIASIDGTARREIVEMGIEAL